jgi:hypothetical protein
MFLTEDFPFIEALKKYFKVRLSKKSGEQLTVKPGSQEKT